MSIQERVQIILKMHNLTPSAFADQIGVQRSALSHVLTGRNKPGLDFLEKILTHFPRVNAHWLITGVAPSEQPKQESVVEKKAESIDQDVVEKNPIKSVKKIVWFFEDGTFEEYIEKQ